MWMRLGILFIGTVVAGGLFLFENAKTLHIPSYTHGMVNTALAEAQSSRGTLLFVGDIMLGRGVETMMNENGTDYPFLQTSDLTSRPDFTMANFEAAIPKTHKKTPNLAMKLSVKPDFMAALYSSGFDALSLANNHSLDFDEAGWSNTIRLCSFYHITCIGHSKTLGSYSVTYTEFGDTRVGILALNTIGVRVDNITLGALLAKMSFFSDIQVVYVHWGEEYQGTNTKAQQTLAHTLIDNGVDVIIGDHPHVVENIELYKGKPIFYSLGNFIFDQYFSDDVQKGLAVEMHVYKDSIQYLLQGVTSLHSKSQPQLMSADEQERFFKLLSQKSSQEISTDIQMGVITVAR